VSARRRIDRHGLALPELGPVSAAGQQDGVELGPGEQRHAEQVEPGHQDEPATESAEDR
jgi:hypothetical protein